MRITSCDCMVLAAVPINQPLADEDAGAWWPLGRRDDWHGLSGRSPRDVRGLVLLRELCPSASLVYIILYREAQQFDNRSTKYALPDGRVSRRLLDHRARDERIAIGGVGAEEGARGQRADSHHRR